MNLNARIQMSNGSIQGSLEKKTFETAFAKDELKAQKKQKKAKKNRGGVKEFIAKLSKGLMLPIAMLPIAGIFLGVGSAIVTNAGDINGLVIFGNFLQVPGNAVFGALPLLFAIAIAIAFTGDAGPAALAAFVGFLVFSALQEALSTPVTYVDQYGATQTLGYNLLFYTPGSMGSISPSVATTYTLTLPTVGTDGAAATTGALTAAGPVGAGLPASLFGSVIGINQLQSSVFGGFVVGFVTAFLYNKFKDIKLHPIIGFFSGVRFVPIVTFAALFPITLVFLMLWPLIGILLALIGQYLGQAVGFNSFIFGYVERALVPFGLHHAFYSPLWYTNAGGSIDMTQQAIIYYNGSAYAVTAGANAATYSEMRWNEVVAALTGNAAGTSNNPYTVAGDQTMWAFINGNLLGRDVNLWQLTGWNYVAAPATGVANYSGISAPNGVTPIAHKLTWADLTSGQAAVAGSFGANGFIGVNVGQYLQGKYVFMIFGLPLAAIAMVKAAPKENRKLAFSICFSAGFTSLLTGITEPIEYTFLFLAPWLFWGVHAIFCALAFGLMNWIGLITIAAGQPGLAPHIGMSFSGGLIDWVIYGGIQIQYGSNAWWSLLFGLVYAPIYYFLFLYVIKKYNIATPGRGDNTKLFTKQDYQAQQAEKAQQAVAVAGHTLNADQILALNVVKAYGGFSNIKNVDACITKLRIQVDNQDIVDTNKLMQLGAHGTIKPSAQSVYAVFGPDADLIKNKIKDLMKDIESNPELEKTYMDAVNTNSATAPASVAPAAPVANTAATTADTNSEMQYETVKVCAPISGYILRTSSVPDETFSKNMMGYGLAIRPTGDKLSSPIDGKLNVVFNTKHAYIFESPKGSQILVHLGIDSINLKDENNNPVDLFSTDATANQEVSSNQDLASVKVQDMYKYAKSPITPIIVLTESLKGRKIRLLKSSGYVEKGQPLFEIVGKTEEPKN